MISLPQSAEDGVESGYRIRRADPEEASLLTEIMVAAKASWGYPSDLMTLWADELVISSRYVRSHATYVVEEGNQILGFCSYFGQGVIQELDNLFVLPEYHGIGVGRALLEFAIEKMRALGAQKIRIVSDPNAVDFYRHFGAQQIGERPSRPAGRNLPIMLLEF